MIDRSIEIRIRNVLWKGKTIVLYGPRQSGKTTLLRNMLISMEARYAYYDADILSDRTLFESENLERIQKDIWNVPYVIIDEAQKISNIGRILKVLHDHIPDVQWIASGSSSFDLAQKTRESMAGRTYEFFLTPFLFRELSLSLRESEEKLDSILRYGLYPAAYLSGGDMARDQLMTLASQIVSKDILELEGIRKWPIIVRLLELLALQIGQIVSYSELAREIGVSTVTVQKYIYLLEEAFIIFSLRGFSRNIRNELKKSPKIYFYDVGIRNAIIEDWKPIHLRNDIGNLWENFVIAEMYKHTRSLSYGKFYFWRTKQWDEIDLISERDSFIRAYEIKWGEKNATRRAFAKFQKWYPESNLTMIYRDIFYDVMSEMR